MKIIFSIAFFCAGGAAFAQTTCATAADLQSGIHLDFADGTTESYRSTGPSTMSVDGIDGTEVYFRLELAHGTHLLSYVSVYQGEPDGESRQLYDYGVPAGQLPIPEIGGRFNTEVTVTGSDGNWREDQFQAYVEGTPLTIGGCTYDVIDVVIAYDTADNYIEHINYLPQLGLGYLLWNQADDGRSDDNVVLGIRTGK